MSSLRGGCPQSYNHWVTSLQSQKISVPWSVQGSGHLFPVSTPASFCVWLSLHVRHPLLRHRPPVWSWDHPSAHCQSSLDGKGQTPGQARCSPASGPWPICPHTRLSQLCLMPVPPTSLFLPLPDPRQHFCFLPRQGPCLLGPHITAFHEGAQPPRSPLEKAEFPHEFLLI